MQSKSLKQEGVGEWMVAQIVIPVFSSIFITIITCKQSMMWMIVNHPHHLDIPAPGIAATPTTCKVYYCYMPFQHQDWSIKAPFSMPVFQPGPS
jgi:hypothetical protein